MATLIAQQNLNFAKRKCTPARTFRSRSTPQRNLLGFAYNFALPAHNRSMNCLQAQTIRSGTIFVDSLPASYYFMPPSPPPGGMCRKPGTRSWVPEIGAKN